MCMFSTNSWQHFLRTFEIWHMAGLEKSDDVNLILTDRGFTIRDSNNSRNVLCGENDKGRCGKCQGMLCMKLNYSIQCVAFKIVFGQIWDQLLCNCNGNSRILFLKVM